MLKKFKIIATAFSCCSLILCLCAFTAYASQDLNENHFIAIDDSSSLSPLCAPLSDILYQVIYDEVNIPVQVGIKPLYAAELPDSLYPYLHVIHADGETEVLQYARFHTPEAIAITILEYEQTPIDTVTKSGLNRYFPFLPNNQTAEYPEETLIYDLRLSVMLSLIDVEQKTTIDVAIIEVADAGRNKRDGIALLLKQFEQQARWEIRRFLSPFSSISTAGPQISMLKLGKDFLIEPGDIFDVFTPKPLIGDSSISQYQRSGILRITHVYPDSSIATTQRQWGRIDSASFAVIANMQPLAFHVNYSPKSVSDYTRFSVNAEFQPFSRFSWLVGAHYHQIRDSYHHLDHGFGLQGGGRFNIFQTPKVKITGQSDFFLDFFFREDDFDNPISTIVPGFAPAGGLTIVLAPHLDLLLSLGYRYSVTTSSWVVNTAEESEFESEDATWLDDTGPQIRYSGYFFRCGFRFIAF